MSSQQTKMGRESYQQKQGTHCRSALVTVPIDSVTVRVHWGNLDENRRHWPDGWGAICGKCR
jgi:hypothetical protein